MLERIVTVIAGFGMTFWATVIAQYEEFKTPPEVVHESPVVLMQAPALDPTISPFESIVSEILKAASTTVATTTEGPRPLPTTVPSVPFTPIPVPTPPVIAPPVLEVPVPTTPVVPDVDEDIASETLLRNSIVNIICLPGGGIQGASGSGVIVDPRGIILTVAHVAQNFLLTDYPEENAGTCYIRTGSPARNAYTAELIYISPDWVRENPGTFLSSRPTGTGEDDFAFLAITGTLTNTPLSRNFSYIPLSQAATEIEEGDEVGIGSYAAEFLTSSEVRSSLYPTISSGPVNNVFTFGRSNVDIFSVRAGSAAQEGSSGGAVINGERRLIGLISTRTVRPDLSMRDLQALTMNHLRRSFRAEMSTDLDGYLRNDIPSLIVGFENEADDLLDFLREVIQDEN